MRRAIAERMTRSVREQPQFSISRDVDMSAANEARQKAAASYTDAIVAACAKALRDHPRLRARIEGDALVTSDAIHVGIAMALDDGLLVPVLRDADRKGLSELAREREQLERHARAGKLAERQLTGAVFTVSNLGTLGVDRFTAIVNPPEAAILAVGRVTERVIAKDGGPLVRPVATLTLSVDHRVADGATAARYLTAVAERLERADL
jgi:pyruvate dehydrogenase E2 component (dihydrolipoamide acetyltransferase)